MIQKAREILVVDDEPLMCSMLRDTLVKKNYQVAVTNTGTNAIEKLRSGQFDLVITDIFLPDINGMDILRTAKEIDPNLGIIMITAHGSVEKAVEAMKVGAFDFLTKGFSIDQIEVTVEKFFKYQRLVQENQMLRSELRSRYGLDNIIGKSPKIQQVFETVEMVAPTKATVLIQGPSGTGKELIARAIHNCSPRREQPFIKTNCAALPEPLIESELFGHEKGAFTGAIRRTKGRFEVADGGTLLLDEISEIKPSLQAKLLRVLQEKEFEKVGNPETKQVDVRVIATTNRSLEEAVGKGEFREDLYYRLNVVPIYVPPLRERVEDIPLLVEHFVELYARENGRQIKEIDERVMQRLMEYDWPGNVRELENTIERAVVICRDGIIRTCHLNFAEPGRRSPPEVPASELPVGFTLRELEKQLVLQTLERYRGNRTRAAKQLGISIRTLRNKLRQYRLEGDLHEASEVGN